MSNPGEELNMRRRTPWKTKKAFRVVPTEMAIGRWVKYCTWRENTKFLVKRVDTVSREIKGDYHTEHNVIKNTTFHLCSGFSVKPRADYWHFVEDEDEVKFTLDDKLFEI